MAQNLLLEIGLEELPAHVVTPSMKQLQENGSFLRCSCITLYSNRSLFNTSPLGSLCHRYS